MIVQPFRTWHLEEIELQSAQAESWRRFGTIAYAHALEQSFAFTARDGGQVLGCAGVLVLEPDVGLLWTFMSQRAGPRLLRLSRMALRLCELSGFARVLATTEADFPQGCRLLRLMGFTFVERAPGYGPDGRDHHFFARSF